MIAALFVQTNGCYFNLESVDPWDQKRDARLYRGPYPVIAHPPCARWGSYWFGSPSGKKRYKLGDDGGCFAYALRAVRNYGGVLEHPKNSKAWDHFGLLKPPHTGGWIKCDDFGWSCCVDQGFYGHRASKATWLYYVGGNPPTLIWGKSKVHNHNPNRRGVCESLSKRERAATPIEFRNLLIDMVETCKG